MLVQVSARMIAFPKTCACCGGHADAQLAVTASRTRGKRVVRTETRGWHFPYCESCIAHVRAWSAANGNEVIALGVVIAIVVGAAAHWAAGVGVGLLSLIPAAIYSSVKRKHIRAAQCAPGCCEAKPAVAYIGWDGSVQSFEITSPTFAATFMQINQRKLVNATPEALDLIASTNASKALAPIARPPQLPRDASEDDLLRWVSKIEGLKGPAARRTALDSALKQIDRADLRDRLMLEASKIEVQAALEKADSLKTVAAKKRALQSALESILSDRVPDHLQSEQIRWLEDALRKLDTG